MRTTIGTCDVQVARRRHHPGGQRVAAQNAAEDVDQHGLHARIGEQNAEGVLHLVGAGAAAHVQEIGGAAAGVLDDVHGRHGQAGAVHHAAHRAIQLDVVQAEARGLHFERVLFVQVAQLDQILVPVQRVVIQGDLGVERVDLAVRGEDERIDFGQRGIGRHIRLGERGHGRRGRIHAGRRDADAECQLARLERRQAGRRVEGLLQNRLRRPGGDFLDLHAARRRGHEDRLALDAVEHDAQVQLALDGQRFFDQQPLHDSPGGTGLVRNQPHAEHVAGELGGFGGILGDLDSAALAAAAGVDLGLDHHAAADLLGRPVRLLDRGGDLATGHRNVEPGQNGLGLILVDFHGNAVLVLR